MIDENLAREGLILLSTAAAMLVEDAHQELLTPLVDGAAALMWAARLTTLGSDLSALSVAALVLARQGAKPVQVFGPIN